VSLVAKGAFVAVSTVVAMLAPTMVTVVTVAVIVPLTLDAAPRATFWKRGPESSFAVIVVDALDTHVHGRIAMGEERVTFLR
jgi:hypothetical protein